MDSALNSCRNLRLYLGFIFLLLTFQCGGGSGEKEKGSINLTWEATTLGVVEYRVYYGSSSRAYEGCADVPSSGTETVTHRLSGLEKGKTYFIAVTAHHSGISDESSFSNEISAVAK